VTLRPEFALGHSEFNAFLFAPVGEDKAGLPLTVLSALTRLGFDPWGEADRLSNLSVAAAVQSLTTAIARLPEGDWKASDSAGIAARLVACLPRRGALAAASTPTPRKGTATQGDARTPSKTEAAATTPAAIARSKPMFWLLCLAAAIGWYMLVSHLTASVPIEQTTTIPSTQD